MAYCIYKYYSDLTSSGFLGEARSPRDGTTVVVKTHGKSNFWQNNRVTVRRALNDRDRRARVARGGGRRTGKAILIIRNPFDAMVSYFKIR